MVGELSIIGEAGSAAVEAARTLLARNGVDFHLIGLGEDPLSPLLRESGVSFTVEPTTFPYGGTDAVLDDGCGNLICLHEA